MQLSDQLLALGLPPATTAGVMLWVSGLLAGVLIAGIWGVQIPILKRHKMAGRTFITSCEVAKMLGYDTTRAFLLNRARLEADFGFPAPYAYHTNPLKWRRDGIETWLDLAERKTALQPDIPEHLLKARRVVLLQSANNP